MLRSKNSGQRRFCLLIIGAMGVAGCRPSDPPPTYNEDLGTEDTVLLPTSSPWHDAAIAKGQADWRPFRKPGEAPKTGEMPGGEAKPAGGNQAIESELRELVNDFNAAIAENKFEDAIDLLIEEQVAATKQIVELIPTFAGKMKQVAEVLPGDNENFKKAVAGMSLDAVLKLEVASITVSSPTEAAGKLTSAGGPVGDVRFVLVKEKEEEYWYIDHPHIRVMAAVIPALQQSLPQLDAFIAGVKSGQISGDALAQQSAALNQMIGSIVPPGSPTSAEPKKAEPEKEAKPKEGG